MVKHIRKSMILTAGKERTLRSVVKTAKRIGAHRIMRKAAGKLIDQELMYDGYFGQDHDHYSRAKQLAREFSREDRLPEINQRDRDLKAIYKLVSEKKYADAMELARSTKFEGHVRVIIEKEVMESPQGKPKDEAIRHCEERLARATAYHEKHPEYEFCNHWGIIHAKGLIDKAQNQLEGVRNWVS